MTRANLSEPRNTNAGLTLIELVVAMSVFALVAIMGVQSLTGTLRQRDRASVSAAESHELGQIVGLIRRDLSTMLPLKFYPPGGGRTLSALRSVPGQVEMSVTITQAYAPLNTGQLAGRVEYRLDAASGTLRRAEWATAWPVNNAARGPDVVVMEGVRALRLRSFWGGTGWINGAQPAHLQAALAQQRSSEGQDVAQFAPEVYSDVLPLAVEITLVTDQFGEIVIMEALQ